jgi:hypothetical protein
MKIESHSKNIIISLAKFQTFLNFNASEGYCRPVVTMYSISKHKTAKQIIKMQKKDMHLLVLSIRLDIDLITGLGRKHCISGFHLFSPVK